MNEFTEFLKPHSSLSVNVGLCCAGIITIVMMIGLIFLVGQFIFSRCYDSFDSLNKKAK